MYEDNPRPMSGPRPGPRPRPRPGPRPGQGDGHGEPVSARRPARRLALTTERSHAWLKMANMKAARLHTSDTN